MDYDVDMLIDAAMKEGGDYELPKTAEYELPEMDEMLKLAAVLEAAADDIDSDDGETKIAEEKSIHDQSLEMAKIAVLIEVAAEHNGMDKEAIMGLGRTLVGGAARTLGKAYRGAGKAMGAATGGRAGGTAVRKGLNLKTYGKGLQQSARGSRALQSRAKTQIAKGRQAAATKLVQTAKSPIKSLRAGRGVDALKAKQSVSMKPKAAPAAKPAPTKSLKQKAKPKKGPKGKKEKGFFDKHFSEKAFKKAPAATIAKGYVGMKGIDAASEKVAG